VLSDREDIREKHEKEQTKTKKQTGKEKEIPQGKLNATEIGVGINKGDDRKPGRATGEKTREFAE